jgi:hypothetical protein
MSLVVAGRKLPALPRDGYVPVTRVWHSGETIQLGYRLRSRVVSDSKHPGMVSIFHGPWLLAVDAAKSPAFFDEPSASNRVKLSPGDVKLDSAPSSAPPAPFTVPVARFRLNYYPGGYPMQPAVALLRPIAEATASTDQNQWVIWLPIVSQRETQDELYVTKPKQAPK